MAEQQPSRPPEERREGETAGTGGIRKEIRNHPDRPAPNPETSAPGGAVPPPSVAPSGQASAPEQGTSTDFVPEGLETPEKIAEEAENSAAAPEAPYANTVRGTGVNTGPVTESFHDTQETRHRDEQVQQTGQTDVPEEDATDTAPGDNLR